MALLTKAKANYLLRNDFVYYWDNDILKKAKFLRADEYSLLTEDGEFLYDEVGETWFLTKFVAKMKKEA